MTDFQKGYKQAVDSFNLTLNSSIQRNNGARTAETVLAVYNDMVSFLNHESIIMNDIEKHFVGESQQPVECPKEDDMAKQLETMKEIIKLMEALR